MSKNTIDQVGGAFFGGFMTIYQLTQLSGRIDLSPLCFLSPQAAQRQGQKLEAIQGLGMQFKRDSSGHLAVRKSQIVANVDFALGEVCLIDEAGGPALSIPLLPGDCFSLPQTGLEHPIPPLEPKQMLKLEL